MLRKPYLKFPKSATQFFGLKMTPLPNLELFRKFIRFGNAGHPLLWYSNHLEDIEADIDEDGTGEVSFKHLVSLFAVALLCI